MRGPGVAIKCCSTPVFTCVGIKPVMSYREMMSFSQAFPLPNSRFRAGEPVDETAVLNCQTNVVGNERWVLVTILVGAVPSPLSVGYS